MDSTQKPTQPFEKSWKDSGFDTNINKKVSGSVTPGVPINQLSDNVIPVNYLSNQMIRLKNQQLAPQGEAGKIYWDQVNKKYKLWVDGNVKWVDLQWSSTSTTSSSSSSSSTSTTTT